MGDVARSHPLVSDQRAFLPECRIDRIVEEVFRATTRLLEEI
jgi:ADP-heptose:LPS heptosyltransferase